MPERKFTKDKYKHEITLDVRKQSDDRYQVDVHINGKVRVTTTVERDRQSGDMKCDCMPFRFMKKCTHIEAVNDIRFNRTARCPSTNTTPPSSTSTPTT